MTRKNQVQIEVIEGSLLFLDALVVIMQESLFSNVEFLFQEIFLDALVVSLSNVGFLLQQTSLPRRNLRLNRGFVRDILEGFPTPKTRSSFRGRLLRTLSLGINSGRYKSFLAPPIAKINEASTYF